MFVTRLNPTGTALDFSTFLGGAGGDVGKGIAVDAAGSAYVTGTAGTGFPTTPGAYDTSSGGSTDAFITKLTAAGDALAYSTFLGGAGYESAEDIAVDADGNTYVTGVTENGFPVTPGAYDTTHNGTTVPDGDGGFIPGRDAFASKLNSTGTALVYSTYLGGSGSDESGEGIAVDASGNVSVTGKTSSPNYPTTPGAFDTTLNGSNDAFVTRLNASGSGLIFSTLLGGGSSDSGNAIAVDAAGYSYITGGTSDAASDYPVTPGAFDTTNGGLNDAFLTRLDPSGTRLAYSTFIGGSQSDSGNALAMTSPESVMVGGTSASADLATTPGAYDTVNQQGLGAGFVATFDLSTPAVGGCKGTTTAGAEMGMYPAQPGAQSGLRVACRFDTAAGESVAPVAFTVHDFDVAKFHNGSARTVSTTGAIASGATTFTVASFAGTAGWVNRPITTVGAVPGLGRARSCGRSAERGW